MNAPAFDDGNPPSGVRAFLDLFRPTPGRLPNTLLILGQVTVTLVIGEVFRIPQISVLVWIAFFLSGNDTASSLTTATMTGGMILLGTGLVILFLTFSLSDAALRLPIMFALTLAAGFLSQAMTMGALANVLLFWIVYMSTNADTLEQVGFALDASVGNTTTSAVPDAAFLPPEEVMVHVLLWTGLVFAVALSLIIIGNLLFGRDPAAMLRSGLALRLRAVADALEGAAPARISSLAREGVAGLRTLHGLAAKLHRNPERARIALGLVRDTGRLVLVACTWRQWPVGENLAGPLADAAQLARLCADVVARRDTDRSALRNFDPDRLTAIEALCAHDPARHPLARELVRSLRLMRALLLEPDRMTRRLVPEAVSHPRTLFKPDAFTNPAYPRAAARLGLSVAICYGIERFTDWSSIGTCVVTCFLVSLSTIGDSLQKMTLRVTGALAGAVCGIGAILLVMPYITDLSGLLMLVIPVAALAAWIKSGSDRIAYAGVQMAFAFFMCVLQGYGPTLDMQTGRDRVIGILIGNIVVFVVSASLWPVSVTKGARAQLVRAVQTLGALITHRPDRSENEAADHTLLVDPERERLRETFGQAIAGVRTALVNDAYEAPLRPQFRQIDTRLLTEIQMLSVPVAVLSAEGASPKARAQLSALHDWFDRFACWIENGRRGEDLRVSLPEAPELSDDPERQYWFSLLDTRIRAILDALTPQATPHTMQENPHHVPA